MHDAARPCIDIFDIDKVISCLDKYKGATLGVKAKDTIKITNQNNEVISTTKRKDTWIIQTPQAFVKEVLLESYGEFTGKDEITDECMLLENLGYSIKIVEGKYENIKLTDARDLEILKKYLKN